MITKVAQHEIAVISERTSLVKGFEEYLHSNPAITPSQWSYETVLQIPPQDLPNIVVFDLTSTADDVIPAVIHINKSPEQIDVLYLLATNSARPTGNWMKLLNRLGAKAYLPADANTEQIVHAIERLQSGIPAISPQLTSQLSWARENSDRPDHTDGPIGSLTIRQIEILALISAGFAVREVAARLHLSPRTVETHKYEMMKKLKCGSVVALCRFAIRHGIIMP